MHCFTQHRQKITWVRKWLTFRLLNRVSYSITQNFGIYLATAKKPSQTHFWLQKKSACFLQHTSCHIDNTSISSSIPTGFSRVRQRWIHLANNVVFYFAHEWSSAFLDEENFNGAQRVHFQKQTRCAKDCFQHILSNHHTEPQATSETYTH